jgi:hypothetical protein
MSCACIYPTCKYGEEKEKEKAEGEDLLISAPNGCPRSSEFFDRNFIGKDVVSSV